jgi:transcriptional regulator with XRE-family HTH domain
MDDWRSRGDDLEQTDPRDSEQNLRRNVATIATRYELRLLADEAWARDKPTVRPAIHRAGDSADADTGRKTLFPDPALVEFGHYLRRARRIARLSQSRVAELSGLSQSTISRLERALAPSVGIDRLVMLGYALGRALPLGLCPHEHDCPWQPPPPPPTKEKRVEAFVATMLRPHAASEPVDDAQADW